MNIQGVLFLSGRPLNLLSVGRKVTRYIVHSGLPLSHSPYKVKSGWVMFTFPSDGMFTNSEGMQCLGEKKNIDPDVFDHVLKSWNIVGTRHICDGFW